MATVLEPRSYPSHREADVVLRDGAVVHIRPVRSEDEPALVEFFRSLSADSRLFRFFSGSTDLAGEATRAIDVDHFARFSLVVLAGVERRLIAHAAYYAGPDRHAEIAWAIADDWQRRGLGTLLLAHLAGAAEQNGIGPFVAYVLPENRQMIEMLTESGVPIRSSRTPDSLTFEFPTSLSAAARERFDLREQIAAAASITALLAPRSVAVVGASRSRRTIGGEVFHNLLETGFAGPVYPVNPAATVVQSVPAYRSVAEIPGAVDLAVIVVPAGAVIAAARECVAKGVRSLVVISAGFGETDEAGMARQRELLAVSREAGIRLVGPNCLGVMNTAPSVRLNATFAPTFPPAGRVGLASQSGALGLAIIDEAARRGIGLSTFVSVGNKADVSANDLLQYWETDPATDVAVLYLESFGNPRKFARISRRIGRTKPILAVKSGRSVAGVRATSSHTGALIAASDVTVDALFRQTGVIRTDTLAELLDAVPLFASQRVPTGDRVAILTNAGGPGILCADACEARALRVTALPESVREELRAFLPAEASVANPIDMIASATSEQYASAIRILAACPEIDAIVAVFIPPLVTKLEDVANAIAGAARALTRPIPLLAVLMAGERAWSALAEARVPVYAYPEDAARALGHAVAYSTWRRKPLGAAPTFAGLRTDEAAGILAAALRTGDTWLAPTEVAKLFSCYELPLAPQRIVSSPVGAAAAAGDLGAKVALKAIAPGLVHKTEAKAVRLGLAPDEVVAAAEEMSAELARANITVAGFLVQPMVTPGIEMLIGVVNDPLFGPVVACGAGGTIVELMKDVSVGVTPLTTADAHDMVRALKTYPLLEGYRGRPGGDTAALEDAVLRVAAMVEAHPEIAELDCNPVVVHESGAVIVDARVRIEAPAARQPLAALRT
ncbi:MAG: GNAT family N-acetyltransferase [Chloroflexota bacterium]